MKTVKYYLSIVWKKKIWILAVTAVATVASYIYTLPSVKPYLYEAKYELRAKNVRSIGFIDIDYVVNSVRYDENFRQSIISKAGEDSKLTENNYSKRILITNDTKTTLSVKGESKEEATRLADILYQSFNEQIRSYLTENLDQLSAPLADKIKAQDTENDSIVKLMETRIVEIYEAVKGELGKTYEQIIGRIDDNVANAINTDPKIAKLKAGLEQNAKYITNTSAMINEASIDISELDSFFDVLHVPSTMISPAPNRFMRLVATAVISFLFMVFVFIFADFYRNYNRDEKAQA